MIRRSDIFVELIMLYLINFNKGDMPLSVMSIILFEEEVGLLYRYNFIGNRMHHKDPATNVDDMINIRKVVLVES